MVCSLYFGDDDEGDFKDLKKNITANFKKFQAQVKQTWWNRLQSNRADTKLDPNIADIKLKSNRADTKALLWLINIYTFVFIIWYENKEKNTVI